MNKDEIQKNINDAVKYFKETLEKTYLEKNKDFFGCGIFSLNKFLMGKCSQTRTKAGHLTIKGDLHKDLFNKNLVGLPLKFDDYNMYPLVILLHNKDMKN